MPDRVVRRAFTVSYDKPVNKLSNADMLIGMDIIGMGDFAVCNTDNKTSFSFAVPPFPDRIDLTAKTEAANKNSMG